MAGAVFGRAIAERLAQPGDVVVIVEFDAEAVAWVDDHPGRPAEAADVVAYLLSEQAAFVSGAIIPIDGGRSARGRDPEEA